MLPTHHSLANTSAIPKANQEIEYLFPKGHGGWRLKSKKNPTKEGLKHVGAASCIATWALSWWPCEKHILLRLASFTSVCV